MRTTHPQTSIKINGQTVSVDRQLKGLIATLNSLPGVETFYSCQGGEGDCPYGYVLLGGPDVFKLLPLIAREIFREEENWSKKHQHVCNGCRSMSVSLEVSGVGIRLNWMPWDLKRIMRITQNAMKTLAQDRPSRAKAFHFSVN